MHSKVRGQLGWEGFEADPVMDFSNRLCWLSGPGLTGGPSSNPALTNQRQGNYVDQLLSWIDYSGVQLSWPIPPNQSNPN